MKSAIAIALLAGGAAQGQTQNSVYDYLGPAALSRVIPRIGQRGGRDVDLRLYGTASGIYDTGFSPVSVGPDGAITRVGGMLGVEAGFGAFGKRQFKRGTLGLDYQGTFRHYTQNAYFSGANQTFTVGYQWQKSRRILFDFKQAVGSSAFANNLSYGLPGSGDVGLDSSALLFDNRTTFLQSFVDMTYVASQRTSFTMGGNWSAVYRQSKALPGLRSYGLKGNIEHRLNARQSVGLNYVHSHYDFDGVYGGSDIDTLSGFYSRNFARWTATFSAGAYRSQVEGVTPINLEPAIAILLGTSRLNVPFYRENVAPFAKAALTRSFRNAVWRLDYERAVSPGNGVYLTSQAQTVGTAFSYQGIRRWTFTANASYVGLKSLGAAFAPYYAASGGGDVGYTIANWVHISAGVAARHQDIDAVNFRRNSTRTSISLVFSPGDIPVSFR